jgi:hypothetical protein
MEKKSEGDALTFDIMMQIGLGQLRFSPSVFYDMTFEEFIAAARGMNEQEEMRQRQEWERARWSAAVALQPHTKKGSKLKPTDLVIFPWEKKPSKRGSNQLLKNALKQMTNG